MEFVQGETVTKEWESKRLKSDFIIGHIEIDLHFL